MFYERKSLVIQCSSHADVGALNLLEKTEEYELFVPRGRRDTMKRVSIQEGRSLPWFSEPEQTSTQEALILFKLNF